MDKLKMAVVGVGVMGRSHLEWLKETERVTLSAVCDIDEIQGSESAQKYNVPFYADHREMLSKSDCDAVLVATPHFSHLPIAKAVFEAGKHLLLEKPVTVHTAEAEELNRAYEAALTKHKDLRFGVMFQMRCDPLQQKIKDLIDSGELGKLMRATWIITTWYRTQRYYDSGGWRASWAGEGGGVLLNQCPHQLDLWQWFFGLPDRVSAIASLGKYHDIEVEDEVSAFMQYDDGLLGHFITSTAETPGTNRLEIIGENGKLVCDNKLTFYRNRMRISEHIRKSEERMGGMETWTCDIPVPPQPGPLHKEVHKAFCNAVLDGTPLAADGRDGIRSVMLGNAMLLSGLENRQVELPLDAAEYEKKLNKLIAKSRYKTKEK